MTWHLLNTLFCPKRKQIENLKILNLNPLTIPELSNTRTIPYLSNPWTQPFLLLAYRLSDSIDGIPCWWSRRSRSDLLWTSPTRCSNASHQHWRRSWNRLQRIQINRVGYLRRLHSRRVRRGGGPSNSLCLWPKVHQAPYHLQREWPSHCLSPLDAHIRSHFSKRVRISNHVLTRVSVLRRLTLRRSSRRLHELVFGGNQRRLRDLFDLRQSVEATLRW